MPETAPLSRYAPIFGLTLFAARAGIHYANGDFNLPLTADEPDYLDRGMALAETGLKAISDGYRPPFFIFVVAIISQFFSADTLATGVRMANLAFVCAIPTLWLWAAGSGPQTQRPIFLAMAGITAFWPPFFHYAVLAEAEPISFLAVNALIVLVLNAGRAMGYRNCLLIGATAGVLLAILGLTKANNLLIAPGVAIVTLFRMRAPSGQRLAAVTLMTAVTIVLIFPWAQLIQSQTGQYKMTTTAGLVLLIGTGQHSLGMEDSFDRSSLHEDYIFSKQKFHPTPFGPSSLSTQQDSAIELATNIRNREAVSMSIAKSIWRHQWPQQSVYGALKILHSLGGSVRSIGDYVLLTFTVLTLVATWYCIRVHACLSILCLHWSMALSGFIVAFFFLPYIRFKTFYFDTTGLLLICAATYHFLSNRSTDPQPGHGDTGADH